MTMRAFFRNGGMTTEPGPEDCATAVADAVEADPPGLNAGGGGELHPARPVQIRPEQRIAARVLARMAGAVRAAGRVLARIAGAVRAAGRVLARMAGAVRAVVRTAGPRWRFMRLMSSRRGGARR